MFPEKNITSLDVVILLHVYQLFFGGIEYV